MNTQNRVFNVIKKEEKVELATQKVELTLVNDAKTLIKQYADVDEDRASSLLVDAEFAYEKVSQEYKQIISALDRVYNDLDQSIQKIGINRSNFGVLDDLRDTKEKAKERLKIAEKAVSKIKSISI